MRTQVGIIGAGPAGLLLSHLLAQQGIDSIVIEDRSRDYVEARVRAGVLEQGAVDTLIGAGLGDRLQREGVRHDGIYLQWPGERHRLNFPDLCGRSVWIYGQTELTKDLFQVRAEQDQQMYFEVSDVRVDGLFDKPRIHFLDNHGSPQLIECDVIAGCDGFQGVTRESVPTSARTIYQRTYPYAWLGILAQVPPSTDELIYALHPHGFALHSMRSDTVSRLYLQVPVDDVIENWSDDRIWSELQTRLGIDGWTLHSGPTLEKSITPLRSYVNSPMRFGALFLAGDASHIVPPTGAKGLNLAIHDVTLLAEALVSALGNGRYELIDSYSDRALDRVWRSTHFAWWMTNMLHVDHVDPDAEFHHQMQMSQLQYVVNSRAAATTLAENYTGF